MGLVQKHDMKDIILVDMSHNPLEVLELQSAPVCIFADVLGMGKCCFHAGFIGEIAIDGQALLTHSLLAGHRGEVGDHLHHLEQEIGLGPVSIGLALVSVEVLEAKANPPRGFPSGLGFFLLGLKALDWRAVLFVFLKLRSAH